jgi:hypothetical protein
MRQTAAEFPSLSKATLVAAAWPYKGKFASHAQKSNCVKDTAGIRTSEEIRTSQCLSAGTEFEHTASQTQPVTVQTMKT